MYGRLNFEQRREADAGEEACSEEGVGANSQVHSSCLQNASPTSEARRLAVVLCCAPKDPSKMCHHYPHFTSVETIVQKGRRLAHCPIAS